MRLKLENIINQSSNDASGLLDKIKTKEKLKKVKTSKEKFKKLDNKLNGEKTNSTETMIREKDESGGVKVVKKKIIRKKSEKSDIDSIQKIDSCYIGNKSTDNNNEGNRSNEKSLYIGDNKNKESDGFNLEKNNISTINDDEFSQKKNSLDNAKMKILNKITNIKISENNSYIANKHNNQLDNNNNLFNLDISALNSKNNTLSVNREIMEISPDSNNLNNLKQIKTTKFNTFNIKENDNYPNIPNLNAYNNNNNENIYFDQVLENIQKKNRDKHLKKNKNIDKLLNSVNANLVNSKIYGTLDKNSQEQKKNDEPSSNRNILNSSNFNNLLISSNSELFFDINKSPTNKFDENNYSKIDDDNRDILVLNKNKKNSLKDNLYQIDEVIVKKKKKSSKSKSKITKNNLDNENDIHFDMDHNLKKSSNNRMKISDLNKSSDTEEGKII